MLPTLKNNKAAESSENRAFEGCRHIGVKSFFLCNRDTSVIQTLWPVPLMPVLLMLDCVYY